MTLHMARMRINKPNLTEWMKDREFEDRDYALHTLLSSTFGNRIIRNFRLLTPTNPSQSILYAYTDHIQEDLRSTAQAVAEPLMMSVIEHDTIMTKPMPENWRENQLIGFNIRARPHRRKHHLNIEIPVYPKPSNPHQRYEAHTAWMAEKLRQSNTVSPQMIAITSQAETHALRHPTARPVFGTDVIFQGNMTITDPEAFNELLAKGIGRHKAYGYGMVLLAPPYSRSG